MMLTKGESERVEDEGEGSEREEREKIRGGGQKRMEVEGGEKEGKSFEALGSNPQVQ